MRPLADSDRAVLEAFLLAHLDTSMFLLSNLRAAGLHYEGKPLQGTWLARFDSSGAIAGVACHAWNGMLLLQAPMHAAELAREVLDHSGRALEGLTGPLAQVEAAAAALSVTSPLRSEREVLFTLALNELRAPALAAATRHAREDELGVLARWRYDYVIELALGRPGDEERQDAEEEIRHSFERGELFVLEHEGRLVAKTAFNARVFEAVQIGGVYTPPQLRGRGYAKAVVAGQLQLANVQRALLFTGEHSHAAQRVYRSLGFREAGAYGLVLL